MKWSKYQTRHVYGCRACPFLIEQPAIEKTGYGAVKAVATRYYCDLPLVFPAEGRAADEENWRRNTLICTILGSETKETWYWSPEFCPLRNELAGGVTVVFRPRDEQAGVMLGARLAGHYEDEEASSKPSCTSRRVR